jgi:chorismate dehydratase
MALLRVSTISYLNTAPLMWNFEHAPHREELQNRFEVKYTLPSLCAQALREGSADIGIIPVAAYPETPDLAIIPDVTIAAKGAVRSILMVSRKPLDQIRSVGLDNSSRTSNALLRILFDRFYKLNPDFAQALPQLDLMLSHYDAALLIGDPALKVDRERYYTWDLAEEWQRFTGRPFVFAFWAVRRSAAGEERLQQTARVFQESRDAGLEHVEELVRLWSPRIGLPEETVRHYLTHNIHYHLDEELIAGMHLFFQFAAELSLLPASPELRFIESGMPILSPVRD